MADPFLDLTPTEAVDHFRHRASEEGREAWDSLDRYLRWRLVVYLQDREGDASELRRATLAAARWARTESQPALELAWKQHLELLRDAERAPAAAAELEVLRRPEGRSAELLGLLVGSAEPMRPKELAAELGVSQQQATNLGRKLEEAGLVVRQEGEGRSRWLIPTARGLRLAKALPPVARSAAPAQDGPLAQARSPWNADALASSVKVA